MSEELVDQLSLELIPGIGSRGVKSLISYCGSASEVLAARKSHLLKIPGIGEGLASIIVKSNYRNKAEDILKSAETIDAEVVHYTNPSYPSRLKHIPDSPNVLFKKGKGDLNPAKCVSIVGTRKATPYGKEITDSIINDLKPFNVTIVSGLAYGIDIQAHRTCLNNQISTYGVIAGGLDRIYPAAHKKYAVEMMDQGGIITESIPGTKPDPHLFPARNRIIAGMADVTIVIEAAARGGALITAHLADSYDRLVFAIPGEIGRTYSEGTNRLIATQKALIYTGISDLLYHLNWEDSEGANEPKELPELTEAESQIYSLLSKHNSPLEIDRISFISQIPINQVASSLLNLEFKNLVKNLPGKKFTLSR